ncbi:MAG: hypothetical protein FWC61_01335 [Proteobacteria bacterium]|nr:hypothetical protein [Pseudomonadota bacterium]
MDNAENESLSKLHREVAEILRNVDKCPYYGDMVGWFKSLADKGMGMIYPDEYAQIKETHLACKKEYEEKLVETYTAKLPRPFDRYQPSDLQRAVYILMIRDIRKWPECDLRDNFRECATCNEKNEFTRVNCILKYYSDNDRANLYSVPDAVLTEIKEEIQGVLGITPDEPAVVATDSGFAKADGTAITTLKDAEYKDYCGGKEVCKKCRYSIKPPLWRKIDLDCSELAKLAKKDHFRVYEDSGCLGFRRREGR